MKRKLLCNVVGVLSVFGLGIGFVHAGFKTNTKLVLGHTYFQGALGQVRNTPTTKDYIGCAIAAYGGNVTRAVCYARDAHGDSKACTSTDAGIVEAMRSLHGSATLIVYFSAEATCTLVSTETGSQLEVPEN